MSAFSDDELRYLRGGRQLGRIATVGADGTPHVVPVGWIYNAAADTIDIGGYELEQSKKFRDVARNGRAAIVIDDIESVDPWRPRAVEVRGRAEAIRLPTPLIRIYPERIISWGLPGRRARTVTSLSHRAGRSPEFTQPGGPTMHPFRAAVEAKDIGAAIALLSDDITFRSPIVFSPYRGRAAVGTILSAVSRVFEDFEYVREIGAADARDHALVFRTRVGERQIEGCDFLHTNENGEIDELVVMVRPLSGALALAEAMKEQLASAQTRS